MLSQPPITSNQLSFDQFRLRVFELISSEVNFSQDAQVIAHVIGCLLPFSGFLKDSEKKLLAEAYSKSQKIASYSSGENIWFRIAEAKNKTTLEIKSKLQDLNSITPNDINQFLSGIRLYWESEKKEERILLDDYLDACELLTIYFDSFNTLFKNHPELYKAANWFIQQVKLGSKLDILSFLITPAQRLCRWSLLMSDIGKNFDTYMLEEKNPGQENTIIKETIESLHRKFTRKAKLFNDKVLPAINKIKEMNPDLGISTIQHEFDNIKNNNTNPVFFNSRIGIPSDLNHSAIFNSSIHPIVDDVDNILSNSNDDAVSESDNQDIDKLLYQLEEETNRILQQSQLQQDEKEELFNSNFDLWNINDFNELLQNVKIMDSSRSLAEITMDTSNKIKELQLTLEDDLHESAVELNHEDQLEIVMEVQQATALTANMQETLSASLILQDAEEFLADSKKNGKLEEKNSNDDLKILADEEKDQLLEEMGKEVEEIKNKKLTNLTPVVLKNQPEVQPRFSGLTFDYGNSKDEKPAIPSSHNDSQNDTYPSDEKLLQQIKLSISTAQKIYAAWYAQSNDNTIPDNQKQIYRQENGWFTMWRHGDDGQQRAHNLMNVITRVNNVEVAIQRINHFLQADEISSCYHVHSFASFMLDELTKIPHSPWAGITYDKDSMRYDSEAVGKMISINQFERKISEQIKNIPETFSYKKTI